VQFQVKEQEYFLTFVEEEDRFYVLSETATGMQKIPVYIDVAKWERASRPERRTPRVQ